MKKTYAALLLLTALLAGSCGDGTTKDDPQPTPAIPANSVSLKIDGVSYTVDLSKTVVGVFGTSSTTNFLSIAIFTIAPQPLVVRVALYEYTGKPGKVTTYYPNAPSGLEIGTRTFTAFGTFDCPTEDRSFEVVAADQVKQTVSLLFSGKVCSVDGSADARVISEGQLNLPYQLM